MASGNSTLDWQEPTVAVAATGLTALVWWHTRTFRDRGPMCGTDFTVGRTAALVSPSGLRARRPAKQPSCPRAGSARRRPSVWLAPR